MLALLAASSSTNFSGWTACPWQRMSALQSALTSIFPPASSSRLVGPGQGAVGQLRNVLSMLFKAASAAGKLRLPDRGGSMPAHDDLFFRQRATLSSTRVRFAGRNQPSQIGASSSHVACSPAARCGVRASPPLGGSSA